MNMGSKPQKDLAEWIYGENRFGQDGYHCSACKFFVPWYYDFTNDINFIRGYHYCPHCGKIMVTYTGRKGRIWILDESKENLPCSLLHVGSVEKPSG